MSQNDLRLADMLKQFRSDSGMSQRDLATRLDVTASMICQYENGKRRPSAAKLDAMAREFGLRKEELKKLRDACGPEPELIPLWDKLQKDIAGALVRPVPEEQKNSLLSDIERVLIDWKGMHRRQRRVRFALIPVAGWQGRWLANVKTAELVAVALEEARQVGISHAVVVVARNQGNGLCREVRHRAPKASVQFHTQQGRTGLGQAVLEVKELIKDEPCALILPDERMDQPCLKPILDTFRRLDRAVIAACQCKEGDERNYGIVQTKKDEDGRLVLKVMAEKPGGKISERSLRAVGRYVLTPKVLSALERVQPNSLSGNIELTDAFHSMAAAGEEIDVFPYPGDVFSVGPTAKLLDDQMKSFLQRASGEAEFR